MMKAAQLHLPPACTNVQHQCETCTTGQHMAACNSGHTVLTRMLSQSAYTCFIVNVRTTPIIFLRHLHTVHVDMAP